tara:strand:- start:8 stop:235 length:228 start_codon:yes stop_codon:yes gene_type:complete
MKRLLYRMLNVLASILILAVAAVYATINGFLITTIMNDLRLDTYLGLDTGLAITLAVVMMVYIPAYFILRITERS